MSSDLNFITAPDNWPHWPVLPVKRHEAGRLYVGLVYADGKPVVILDANLFGLGERPGTTWGEKLEGFVREEYPSFEALLEKWTID